MKTLIYVLTGGQSLSRLIVTHHILLSQQISNTYLANGILKNDELLRYINLFLFLFSNKHETNVIIS